jgi:hypothetical protein
VDRSHLLQDENNNEPLGSIKDKKFIDFVRDCLLFKKDSGQ